MTQTHMLLERLRREAKNRRGQVVSDGCGGYEVLAPDGRRWKSAEVSCQPLPLNECEGWREKEQMVKDAISMVLQGTEKLPRE